MTILACYLFYREPRLCGVKSELAISDVLRRGTHRALRRALEERGGRGGVVRLGSSAYGQQTHVLALTVACTADELLARRLAFWFVKRCISKLVKSSSEVDVM